MIYINKRIIVVLLIILVFLQLFIPAVSATGEGDTGIGAVIANTGAFLMDTVSAPGIAQTGGEWTVIALMRSGITVPNSYIRAYYSKASGQLDAARGILSTVKYSEYSRVALAMSAIGADPRNVGGYDMIAPLLDYDMTVNQGINGPIFALIALDGSGFCDEPAAERYIDFILARQLEDGGFTLSGTNSDPDTTAMALTALSRHKSREGVAASINRALERLSQIQRATGGFTSFSSTNSESVSQAIIALCSLGIPVSDERFIKNGVSLLDNLLAYYIEDKGFEHEKGGGANLMATEQAMCALAALQRYNNGQNPLYDMSDAPVFIPDAPDAGLAGKHPDVNVPDITDNAAAFADIAGHKNETAIKALYERMIITGYTKEVFGPDKTVTRAELAAVIVRALGLDSDAESVKFLDVPAGSWYFDFVRTAGGYGLITGRSQDVFDPDSLVTRQETAVIVSRAAALCGMDDTFDETAVRNILAQFTDYRTAAPWASEALAFCYYYGIIDDDGIDILPLEPVSRGEAAEMVFRMLKAARLVI